MFSEADIMRTAGFVTALAYAAFGVGVIGIAAPVPTHLFPKPQPVCFPTKVGTTSEWANGRWYTERVAAVERKDGLTHVTVEWLDGAKWRPGRRVTVSAEGMVMTEAAGREVKHPLWLLKQPHREGNAWEINLVEHPDVKGTKTAHGPERVEVPAGRFDAVRVEVRYTLFGKEQRMTEWYAPDVGRVKMVDAGGGTLELKSFTPGK